MPNTIYPFRQAPSQTNIEYQFREIENQRWGIYIQDRLLATIGSYEACKSISESLKANMSYGDALRAAIVYKKSLNRSLSIG